MPRGADAAHRCLSERANGRPKLSNSKRERGQAYMTSALGVGVLKSRQKEGRLHDFDSDSGTLGQESRDFADSIYKYGPKESRKHLGVCGVMWVVCL